MNRPKRPFVWPTMPFLHSWAGEREKVGERKTTP